MVHTNIIHIHIFHSPTDQYCLCPQPIKTILGNNPLSWEMASEQQYQRIETQAPPEEAEVGEFESEIPHQPTSFDYPEISPPESAIEFSMPSFGDDQIISGFNFQFQGLDNESIPQVTTDPYSRAIRRLSLTPFAGPAGFLNINTADILFTGVPEAGNCLDPLESRSPPGFDPKSELTTPTSSSSWVITTPDSHGSLSPPTSARTSKKRGFTLEEVNEYTQHVANNGPCSKVWELTPRSRGKRRHQAASHKRKRDSDDISYNGPRRRGAFRSEHLRQQTAVTRKNRSCIRCRMLQNRCEPDPYNPAGICLNCKNVVKPIMCKLPCLRWIITDSSLYREQVMPYQLFSRRWQSMDLVDISNWASSETKTIRISQIFLDAPYEVEVREFVPVEGDMIDAIWTSGSVVKRQRAPLYALSNMEKTARMLRQFIDANIARYIYGVAEGLDPLFWNTYMFAFRYIGQTKTPEERELLENTFRLWVGCRKTSNPHRIYGDDTLGGQMVDDPDSIFHNVVPMPVIMISQMECIMYTTNLRPMSKKVLHDLNVIVRQNKRKYWLTIYLTMFILLHSCSLVTKRDWENARQYDLSDEFSNPESIRKHHCGAEMMLAHFHYLNKGAHPFGMAQDAAHRRELARAAELDENGVHFVWDTAKRINDPDMRT
ncbi:hypothetical protein F4810DRAFT_703882 [Camillea tinctor]|nr:hypothetical protein F4810DRAFT_703882 [Camillea tinctor]